MEGGYKQTVLYLTVIPYLECSYWNEAHQNRNRHLNERSCKMLQLARTEHKRHRWNIKKSFLFWRILIGSLSTFRFPTKRNGSVELASKLMAFVAKMVELIYLGLRAKKGGTYAHNAGKALKASRPVTFPRRDWRWKAETCNLLRSLIGDSRIQSCQCSVLTSDICEKNCLAWKPQYWPLNLNAKRKHGAWRFFWRKKWQCMR